MTDYAPPRKDMLFALRELTNLNDILELPGFSDFDWDVVVQVVEESGKFAAEVLSPINVPGDRIGASLGDNGVVAAGGFADAYSQFVDNGWQSIDVATEHGGMGMPGLVASVAMESWQSACMSFSLAPMLTSGAIFALNAHGSDALKATYLPNMASGNWTGTMNLTEPQAGSDLSVVATKAVQDGDHYRISGSKIFITWGDHDLSENIVHFVLARLPDAPDGVRGISLFLVPKFLPDADGNPGKRNDVHVASIEHKLGIHASPTCVMSFGASEGAIGYLVGEENRGLACMFTMMNHARVAVGIQGLGISERAYQLALSFALDRKQGRAPGVKGSATIVHHPDVRRMLLTMKSQVEAIRGAAYYASGQADLAHHAESSQQRERAAARFALLTPIVKAWPTETAQEIASLGVQIQGGMGFVEESGAAQYLRDARILTIYEGTTGIQALDLVGRKILADEGKAIRELLSDMRAIDEQLSADERLAEIKAALQDGCARLDTSVNWLLENGPTDPNAGGSASFNLLMLAGVVVGGWQMARAGLAVINGAAADDTAFAKSKLLTVLFYAQHIMPRAAQYAAAAIAGSDALMAMPEDLF